MAGTHDHFICFLYIMFMLDFHIFLKLEKCPLLLKKLTPNYFGKNNVIVMF